MIARDPTQPRGHGRPASLVLVRVAHRGEKRFLRNILGRRWGCGHVQRKPVHVPLTASKQRGERLSIAGGDADQQLVVRGRVWVHDAAIDADISYSAGAAEKFQEKG
jgi:hypothetical protein